MLWRRTFKTWTKEKQTSPYVIHFTHENFTNRRVALYSLTYRIQIYMQDIVIGQIIFLKYSVFFYKNYICLCLGGVYGVVYKVLDITAFTVQLTSLVLWTVHQAVRGHKSILLSYNLFNPFFVFFLSLTDPL
jgi:hypothetical protein